MSALNDDFPWTSHYGHYKFFEKRMDEHGQVLSCKEEASGIYTLTRKRGHPLRIFICECYSFGVAEYMEVVDKIGKIDVVIINSIWCGYTWEAKLHCRKLKVGLFMIGEFMAALNRDDYWNYLTDEQKEDSKEKGWS